MTRLLSILTLSLLVPLSGMAQEKLDLKLLGDKSQFSGGNFGTSPEPAGPGVKVTAKLVPINAQELDVQVHVELPPHNHIYTHTTPFGVKTKIAINTNDFVPVGQMRPDRRHDVVKQFGETMEQFEDEVTWSQRLRLKSGTLQPGMKITGELTGQYCSDKQCLMIDPPAQFEASLPADFVAPAGPTASAAAMAAATQVVVPEMRGFEKPPIKFTVSLSPANPGIGDYVTLSIKADIDEPYHAYSITQDPEVLGGTPTKIDVAQLSGAAPVRKQFTATQPFEEKKGLTEDEVLEIHHGTVEWTQEYVVSDENVSIGGTIRFQICDKTQCQPPAQTNFLVSLGEETTLIADTAASATSSDSDTSFGGEQKSAGLLPFILSAVSAGFLALLTPCVFPMIPVTVSYFLKQGEENPGSTLKLAITYCLSIIAAFTVMGLLVSVFAGPEVLNQIATNRWLNLFFAAVFTVFALMLLGMFEFQIPSWLLTWTSKKQEAGGMVGVVFMALTFTLVSFTCTFAFVGNVLVLAASGEDYLRPIIGMAAFSAAFASPFFLLAMFPSYLKKLPKSGGWMNRVKVTLGLLEVAIVAKFLSVADVGFSADGTPQFIDYHLVMGCWMVVAIVTGLYLLNVFKMPHDTPTDSVGPLSCMFSLGFFGLAAYIGVGMFSAKAPTGELWQQIVAFAPPQINVSASADGYFTTHDGLTYDLDFDAAVESASEANKPLFVDFTGVNCQNCRLMEQGVLATEPVHNVLKDLVLAQLYTDEVPGAKTQPEVHDRLLKRNHGLQEKWLQSTGIPEYVIATPDGKEVLARFSGLDRTNGKEFQEFLKYGMAKWKERKAATDAKDAGHTMEHTGLTYDLDFDSALQTASADGTPLFVEFTGINDVNSRLMEQTVLAERKVQKVLKHLARTQLFLDEVPGVEQPEVQKQLLQRNYDLQQRLLGSAPTPAFVIVTPDGNDVLGRFVGLDPTNGKEFQEFLKTGMAKWEEHKAAIAAKESSDPNSTSTANSVESPSTSAAVSASYQVAQ